MKDDSVSRQAVVDAVKSYWKKVIDDIPKDTGFDEVTKLCDMALEHNSGILKAVDGLPSAQPEIIRCRDCKYWREHKYAKETKRYIPFCGFNAIYTKADDFCSRAERKENR